MEDHCCLNPVFTKLIKRDALFCTHCQQVRMMSKSVMYRFYLFYCLNVIVFFNEINLNDCFKKIDLEGHLSTDFKWHLVLS